MPNDAYALPAEAFDLKDILDPVVVNLVAPAPTVDRVKFGARKCHWIAQRRQEHFGVTAGPRALSKFASAESVILVTVARCIKLFFPSK